MLEFFFFNLKANWFYVSTQLMKQLKIQQIERSRKREERGKKELLQDQQKRPSRAEQRKESSSSRQSQGEEKVPEEVKSDKKNDWTLGEKSCIL